MSQDQYERSLLEAAKEVSARIEGRPPSYLKIRWAAGCEPDEPLFRHSKATVVLHDRLKGKLTPDEWRPLFASSLFYQKMFRKRRLFGTTIYMVSSTFVSIVLAWLIFFQVLPLIPDIASGSTLGAGKLVVFVAITPFLLFAAAATPYMKKLRLGSDRIACNELGIHIDLLNTLRKIDSLFIGQKSGVVKIMALRPTIVERIQDLSRMQQQ